MCWAPRWALLITGVVSALSACAHVPLPSSPSSPSSPSGLGQGDLSRLSRCATSTRSGLEPPSVEAVERAQPEPLITALEERAGRLALGPLLEDWLPLITPLKPSLQPRADAWVKGRLGASLQQLWVSADLLISLGAPLEQVLRPLIRRDLSSLKALSWLRAAPELSPLAELTVDIEAEVAAWRKARWAPLREGSVGVILEEQRLLYLGGSGEGVRLVQEAVRVNNKQGVEELGEVALPVNATLLGLYTLKPNGARRAPIVIPEKDSYSLQDLQVGDVIIARYLEPLSALRRSGGALTPRLPVHEPDRAVWRRLYHAWRLGDQPLTLYLHHAEALRRQASSPALSVSQGQREGGRYISVSIERALPRPAEPSSLSAREAPAFQLSERVDEEREWGEVLSTLRQVATLDADQAQALRTWALGLSRLGARVWAAIEEERPLLESLPPYQSLTSGRGSRALALWGSLSALGERCELWLARPPEARAVSRWALTGPELLKASSEALDPSLSSSSYEHLLIACRSHDSPLGGWVLYDPSLYLSPRGVVNTSLFGGEALSLWPPPVGARCELLEGEKPRAWPLRRAVLEWPEEPQERHELSVELWLDPDGGRGLLGARVLLGHAEHSLSGEEGALLYERLSQVSEVDRVGWLERQWGRWLGATAVTGLRFAWSEAEGLALSYEIRVSLRLPARLALSPQRWGERFGSLTQRQERLALVPIHQRLTLTLRGAESQAHLLGAADRGARLTLKGSSQALSWPSTSTGTAGGERSPATATYQQHIEGDQATLTWWLRGELVDPSQYPSWSRFAQQVSAHERGLQLTLNEGE